MQWFGIAFMPMFVSSLFPFIFTALKLPGVFCLAMALALVVRVGAELALVPSMGYIGACVVAVFSEIGAFAILIYFLKRKGYVLHITEFPGETDFGWSFDGRDASSRAAAYAVTGAVGGRGGWHRVSRCSLFARDFFKRGVASYARWSRFC